MRIISARRRPFTAPVFCDQSQNISFRPPTEGVLPTLLRSSEIWTVKRRRLMLPEESLEAMGFAPFYMTDAYAADERELAPDASTVVHRPRLMDAIAAGHFRPRGLRQLAGNSMQAAVIRACELFLLAFTEKTAAAAVASGAPSSSSSSSSSP